MAAVVPQVPLGRMLKYRMYVRIDASKLFQGSAAHVKPIDWDDKEDGEWELSLDESHGKSINCLARYFQFTTSSGKHEPFGLWPANAMCKLTPDKPIAHDSFDLALPEALTQVIGGAVLGGRVEKDVRLPR